MALVELAEYHSADGSDPGRLLPNLQQGRLANILDLP